MAKEERSVGCRARAWRGGLPSSSGCWRAGPTQTPFWETCFPARLRVPSPSAPEAFILGTLTGGLQMKRENNNNKKKCILKNHLQIPTAQGSECKTPRDLPCLLQEEDRSRKIRLLKQPLRHHLLSCLSLFALYLKGKWRKKETWYLNQRAQQFAFIWFALHLHG